jgi:hypothetical protein
MECLESVPCDLCGFPAMVVFHRGFERGRRVLKPALFESDDGVYLFLDCPIHGRRAQAVTPACNAHLGKRRTIDEHTTRNLTGSSDDTDISAVSLEGPVEQQRERVAPRQPK